jgi:Spy/CpxP family protein refolding chaperone
MKTTLCCIASIALMMLLTVNSFAQQGTRRGGRDSAQVIKQVENLAKDLSLTADQKAKIQTLSLTQFNEMKGKMKPGERPDQTTRDAMKASRDKLDKDINAILTTEQQAKYKKVQEEHQKNRQQRGNGGEPKND